MSSVFNKSGHLNLKTILSLKSGNLSEIELLRALEHISDCRGCADVLSDSYSEAELSEVPSGFDEEIIEKVYPITITKRQFIFYSLRVGIAACAALVLVTVGSFNFLNNINSRGGSIKAPDLSFVNSINTGLKDFSHKIINMEVFKNEKEEK